MDSNLRLQPGLVFDPTAQVAARSAASGNGSLTAGVNPYSLSLLQSEILSRDLAQAQATAKTLHGVPGLLPSLSTGQGFYTVESLQGATSVPLPASVAAPSYDAIARSYTGGYAGMSVGQQGLNVAAMNQLLAQQAASQKTLAAVPSAAAGPLLLPSQSVPVGLNTGGVGRGAGNVAPFYAYQPYGQPNIALGHGRCMQHDSAILAEALLRVREREIERERAREREQEKEREQQNEREKESERKHEREKARDRTRRDDRSRSRSRSRTRSRSWSRRSRSRNRRGDRSRSRSMSMSRFRPRSRTLSRSRSRSRSWSRERRRDHERRTELKPKRERGRDRKRRRRRGRELEAHSKDKSQKEGGRRDKEGWCSLCKVDCTTRRMLKNHLRGKRHKTRTEEEVQVSKEQEDPEKKAIEADKEKNTQEMLKVHSRRKKHKALVEADGQEQKKQKKAEEMVIAAEEMVSGAGGQLQKGEANNSSQVKKIKVNGKVNTRIKPPKPGVSDSKADAGKASTADGVDFNATAEPWVGKDEIEVKDQSVKSLKDDEDQIIGDIREENGSEFVKDEASKPEGGYVCSEVTEAIHETETVKIQETAIATDVKVEVVKDEALKREEGNVISEVIEAIQETTTATDVKVDVVVKDEASQLKEGDTGVQHLESLQETAVATNMKVEEVMTSEQKAGEEGGFVKEVNEGNDDNKSLDNPHAPGEDVARSQGEDSVLVKKDLEVEGEASGAKKSRLLKSKGAGASRVVPAGSVRCEVCKVTCRNATVYETHLKGEKHAERLKKAQSQVAAT